ncbi:MAG TPA: HlyD family type I secretion periplasmic adaptor subunit [Steroidobacter sp.]
MTPAKVTFASLLADDAVDADAAREIRDFRYRAFIPAAAAAVLLALWSVAAPLSGAIIAVGKLKVELNRKTVQHQEGGIVREILVRDGQRVRAGQPLIVVGDVRNEAELSMLSDQLVAERLRHARALAESALATKFERPYEFSVSGELWERERALFEARQRTLKEQIASVQTQMRDTESQVGALTQQIESTTAATKLADEELSINEKLVRDGFVQRARLLQLQRDVADYRSRLAESHSDLALARQRGSELQARIVQVRNQYQQASTDEAKEASGRIRELEERLRPSRDQADRRYVRAPVDGQVMALRVSSVGEVIAPRDPLLDIVPNNEKLVVEARIRPQDINNVRERSKADVRLLAFDARTTPLLPGEVTFVSADRMTSTETGEAWYVATVAVSTAALVNHPEIQLQPGMPAELFVKTPERTLLQYLAAPVTAFTSRAMREP